MPERALLEVGVAGAMLRGQSESGDLHLVLPHDGGVLVAAIDGLGHGSEAAHAARLAVEALSEEPGSDLPTLFARAHSRLARSRGVVMSLASFPGDGTLTWLGVGNVEGRLVRSDQRTGTGADAILVLGGVVGYQLPKLRPSSTLVEPGDTLIFTTDGIHSGYAEGLELAGGPQALADRILEAHGKGGDDALVLVARYLG